MITLSYKDSINKRAIKFTAALNKDGSYDAHIKVDPPFKVGQPIEDPTGLMVPFMNMISGIPTEEKKDDN